MYCVLHKLQILCGCIAAGESVYIIGATLSHMRKLPMVPCHLNVFRSVRKGLDGKPMIENAFIQMTLM